MDSDRIGPNDVCESVNSFTQINKAACQYHTPDSTSIPKKGRLLQDCFQQPVRNFVSHCHSCTKLVSITSYLQTL